MNTPVYCTVLCRGIHQKRTCKKMYPRDRQLTTQNNVLYCTLGGRTQSTRQSRRPAACNTTRARRTLFPKRHCRPSTRLSTRWSWSPSGSHSDHQPSAMAHPRLPRYSTVPYRVCITDSVAKAHDCRVPWREALETHSKRVLYSRGCLLQIEEGCRRRPVMLHGGNQSLLHLHKNRAPAAK